MSNTDSPADLTPGRRGKFAIAQPALLAGILALLLAIVASDVWISREVTEDFRLISRSLEVQNKVTGLALELRRAESAQRGYLLSEQPQYLDDYRRYAANAPRMFRELQDSATDIERRDQQLRQLAPLIGQKFEEMNRTMALAEAGRIDEARKVMREGIGREAMANITASLAEMRDAESALLAQRRDITERMNRLSLAVTFVGAAAIVVFGILSILLLRRSTRQRDRAQRALQSTNENLEATVAERTADLREANNEIQRFAYIVSHDLRSPLVNIMGFTTEIESIKKDIFDQLAAMHESGTEAAGKALELSPDFDESLAFIKSSIGKMDRLINSILKLSREGQRTFKPEYVSMDQLIKAITDTVAHQAADRGVALTITPLPPIKSDRLALEQVFSNLVDNALKYTHPDRPGHIQIRGRTDNAQVVYEVEDNGRGIAPEDHQRVFDLFRRAGEQDQKGEGIGLAHTRALVRRLGGYMTLKSEIGEGSTFIVTLPRRIEDERLSA